MTTFITVYYNGNLEKLAASISNHHELVVFTHSENPIPPLSRPVTLFNYRTNRGLSKSWNEGIIYGLGESVILVNDDVYFDTPMEADKMAELSKAYPIITAAGFGYSCFGLRNDLFFDVGGFDQNIFPAYYEDCDYSWRIGLAGYKYADLDIKVHHVGSGTIKNDPALNAQNFKTMQATQRYYILKWGGINSHEKYKHPFNDPRYSYAIPLNKIHNPYDTYDRRDQGIVKL